MTKKPQVLWKKNWLAKLKNTYTNTHGNTHVYEHIVKRLEVNTQKCLVFISDSDNYEKYFSGLFIFPLFSQ